METGVEATTDTLAAPGGLPVACAVDPPSVAEALVTVIEPRSGWQLLDLKELWRYRELLAVLTWRDVQVRYKQTVLGIAWAVLQPLAMVIVFSLFFNRLGEGAATDVAYPIFVFAGILPWFLFANILTGGSGSVVGSGSLVTKVYFPRLLIPLSAAGPYLIDCGISFVLLLAMMAIYRVSYGWGLLLAPLFVLGLTIASLGVGILLAALTVTYRDFRYVVPFTVQLWMFATPAIYMDATSIGEQGRWLLPLNPAYGLIANFRAAVLGQAFDLYALSVSCLVAVALLVVGCLYFRRVERDFADVI